jgi:hypothetical protein
VKEAIMKNRTHALVATPWSDEATNEKHGAGTATWWDLTTTSLLRLESEWGATGLSESMLPSGPSPLVALHRAVETVSGDIDRIVPLRNGRYGYAVMVDDVDDVVVKSATLWSVWLDAETKSTLEWYFAPGLKGDQSMLKDQLMEEMETRFIELSSGELSVWLNRLVHSFGAVSLRDAGGFYFIPAEHREQWSAIAKAVGAAGGGAVWEMPVMRTAEAAAAIVNALSNEIAKNVSTIEEQLARGPGKRALESRAQLCQALVSKVAAYESLVGSSLDDLRANLDALRAKVTTAIMVASAEEEA